MEQTDVGLLWNSNAQAWIKLASAGYDVYRDFLNTSAFFELLPDVSGLSGLDIGCGEGQLCGSAAVAQLTTGSITGTVTDQSGASVPGVAITVRNAATGVTRATVTGATGRYEILSLPEIKARQNGDVGTNFDSGLFIFFHA